jgi:hypothetical protein
MTDLATLWHTWAQGKSVGTPGNDKTIAYMHRLHGIDETHRCRDCAELWAKQFTNRYYHCRRYDKPGTADGGTTDWRLYWMSCGLWRAKGEAQP